MPVNPFPPIPVDPEDWVGLRNLLIAFEDQFGQTNQDLTPPGPVVGLTVTANNNGSLVAWAGADKAAGFLIWRNTTGTFGTATLLAQLMGAGNLTYFDSTDQTTANKTRYYWVAAINQNDIQGPVSAFVSGVNFAGDPSSTAVGTNALASGTNATAVGANSIASGANSSTLGVSSTAAGANDVVFGEGASTPSGGNTNTVIGATSSIAAGTGVSNVIVGFGSTLAANKSSTTVVGVSVTATGSNNVIIGGAGADGSGTGNVAAGFSATTASGNTSNNTAVGANSSAIGGATVAVGQAVTTGTGGNNTATGQNATTAAGNTANNVAEGQGATATGGNSTAVGQGSSVSGANSTSVGRANSITSATSLAIGENLTVTHINNALFGQNFSSNAAGQMLFSTDGTQPPLVTGNQIQVHHASTDYSTICMSNGVSNGSVFGISTKAGVESTVFANITGAGTFLPINYYLNGAKSFTMRVDGNMEFPRMGTSVAAANAVFTGGTNALLLSTSSRKYKTNINTLTLEDARRILDFRPVSFNSLADGDDPDHDFWGLIEEEVDETLPGIFTGCNGVMYPHLTAPLIRLIQDQEQRITALESRSPAAGSTSSLVPKGHHEQA